MNLGETPLGDKEKSKMQISYLQRKTSLKTKKYSMF